ncbi:hypothetical protein, unknown function [Leishmania infantum JPCM5]|uniref:Uncharacterized protein n=2 Tax=Leishmania infantum TaxID=5671 RepID=A4IB65_LEIIN|nr:hypothetical protein, unknown function [Leishmania infantum JPCM5]CAC9544095.1 hypothetical_protein_-_conserved [Leishmania infantum]CAM72079.1 hypothetical protein, unknown function [Leishmania infantum JPCM5]SUZ45994.1 hypothetical_protein_-_conserved [Leishmania infantum]|eukprot:XP_001468984.1 hypothetical protein, unknown function [Leishmania infantum JPCM5]
MPSRIVRDPGVPPTLVARPEDVFEDSGSGYSSMWAHALNGVAVGERYDTAKSSAAATPPVKWDRDEALWQLKIALGVSPVLRERDVPHLASPALRTHSSAQVPLELKAGDEAAAAVAQKASTSDKQPPSAQEGASRKGNRLDHFIPPVYRFSSASSASSSPLSQAYVQTALARIQDECDALMQRLGVGASKSSAELNQANTDMPDDELQAAQLMRLLAEPSTLAQLQRRADAAILEKECVFRIRDLLAAELQRRHVPLEAAQDDFYPFFEQVDRTKMALEDYYHVQSAMHTMAPMMEAAVAVAECLRDVDATTSMQGMQRISAMEAAMNSLLAQVQEDAVMLQKNLEALRCRFEAL